MQLRNKQHPYDQSFMAAACPLPLVDPVVFDHAPQLGRPFFALGRLPGQGNEAFRCQRRDRAIIVLGEFFSQHADAGHVNLARRDCGVYSSCAERHFSHGNQYHV